MPRRTEVDTERSRTRIELTRLRCFEASHRYWCADWSPAENRARFGRCTSRYGHGHNYTLAVSLQGSVDPRSGMVLNLHDLDRLMASLIGQFDHQYLNESVPAFRSGTQPTAEALAVYCYRELTDSFRGCGSATPLIVGRVSVHEDDTLSGWCATRMTQGDCMEECLGLTRSYTFSAAHRLHEPTLSDTENRSLFGKCNNPAGHGHDFRLDVTVSGPLHPKTSMVVDLADLDEAVQARILERLDHRHLNHEVPPFDQLNPTSENLLRVIWDWFEPVCPAPLLALTIYETPRNRFTLRRSPITEAQSWAS